MDVTRHTFHEQLENIIQAIDESTFIAIDGEFTGLSMSDAGCAAPFDTPEERYLKIRDECSGFLLVQFGMCTFKANEQQQKYEARPYNFYVFPKPFNKQAPDYRFVCQSSSIDFLISQGFDFNKLFRDGIPFLAPDDEKKLKVLLQRRHSEENKQSSDMLSPDEKNAKKITVLVPEDQQQFLNNIYEQIDKYLQADEDEPLTIPPCNAFQRKLIYQTVEEKYPLVHLETKTGEKGVRFMVISRAKTAEEQQKLLLEKQDLEKMELDIQVGFSKVIKALTKSGKLIVGHNMFLDVFHVLNSFTCTVPADVNEFKTVVKSVFPRLLDTKLMATTQPFQEHISYSSLEDVKRALQQSPFVPAKIEPAEGFDRYDKGEGGLHEAGFDAYLTGRCFVTMTNYLGSLQDPPAQFTLPTSHLIDPFVNKLYLMKINDVPYLNLDGPDLEMKRDHIFHVTFPREWKSSDLHALFQPYGNINVSWLSDFSALVALYKKENAALALKALSQNNSSFFVTSYASYQRNKLACQPLPNSSPRNICKKRKLDNRNEAPTQKKIKRKSFSDEFISCPAIPEENEDLNNSKSDPEPVENTKTSDQSTEGKKEKEVTIGKPKDKLFEEPETWL